MQMPRHIRKWATLILFSGFATFLFVGGQFTGDHSACRSNHCFALTLQEWVDEGYRVYVVIGLYLTAMFGFLWDHL
ncbi:hypothetical protein RA28_08835 [Ruegeria sp. ANG-S4]|nr:hypothetical protein RA28_08835 [Ruegeria sp. ANG-S4]